MLGPWYGALAAGLGSALYDCLNPLYIAECWITFLTKGAYGLVAGLLFWNVFKANAAEKNVYGKAAIASAAGAVTYAVLYLLKSYLKGIWVGGLTHSAALVSLAAKLPPVLYTAIRAALKKSHLEV